MKLKNRTIVVTGGGRGIGLALVRELVQRDNRVIIGGRDQATLDAAVKAVPGLVAYPLDIAHDASIERFAAAVERDHPASSVLINNAGVSGDTDLRTASGLERMEAIFRTNLFGPARLTARLLPLLQRNPSPAVVNVTSGLAYLPLARFAVYSASKAALHSLTQSLRVQLAGSGVHVVELLPPTVDTDMAKAVKNAKMSAAEFAVRSIEAFEAGEVEIRIGQSAPLYAAARLAPLLAVRALNVLAKA